MQTVCPKTTCRLSASKSVLYAPHSLGPLHSLPRLASVPICPCVPELRDLIQEVHTARQQGEVHDTTDTVMSILLELQVRGKRVKLPYVSEDPRCEDSSVGSAVVPCCSECHGGYRCRAVL